MRLKINARKDDSCVSLIHWFDSFRARWVKKSCEMTGTWFCCIHIHVYFQRFKFIHRLPNPVEQLTIYQMHYFLRMDILSFDALSLAWSLSDQRFNIWDHQNNEEAMPKTSSCLRTGRGQHNYVASSKDEGWFMESCLMNKCKWIEI